MTLQDLADQLQELEDSALLRSKTISDNGREVDEVTRAKADGAAQAYNFCIMQLRHHFLKPGRPKYYKDSG